MMISRNWGRGAAFFVGVALSLTSFAWAADAPAPAAPAPAPAPMIGPMPPAVESSAPGMESTGSQSVLSLPPGVVAMVNGEQITDKEWLDTLTRVYGRNVLGVMINHKLVRQAAAQRGIALTDAEIQADFDKNVAQAGGMEALLSRLGEMGEALPDYRELLKTQALLRKLVVASVTVTDEDLQNTFLEQYGPKADVQVIVADSQSSADQAVAEARGGADFGDVATRHSTDENTLRNHAFLPMPLSKGFFPKPFGDIIVTKQIADTIFAMKQGGITNPIQADKGFYVFKLVVFYPARDIKFDTVKDQVKSDFIEVKTSAEAEQFMQKLAQSADIRVGIQ